jgi:CubicO group peptidase (beta-lactamase class C family)
VTDPAFLQFSRRGLLIGGAAASLPLVGSDGAAARRPARREPLDGLPRARPELLGLHPDAMLRFLDEVASRGLELHGYMLARRGQVISEGWWWPYRADRPHMLHSATKSFAVSGVGLALDEGRFRLDDKVISFFPDELPAKVSDNLAAMTVRDLLTMQTGHETEISGSVWRQIKSSWVAEFLKVPVVYRPGTHFVYTSAASFMLSAIVTRTTGQTLHQYMEPRFFRPLGMRGISWDVGPGGINPGGNGLTCRTSDLLKLGMVHAQKGVWRGRRVLSEKWVRAATSPQVPSGKYGYQWWIGPGRAYYALGLFTQLSIVFPEHDAVLAINGAIDGSSKLLPTIWKHFPAAFAHRPIPFAEAAHRRLVARTRDLSLLPRLGTTRSPVAPRISGRVFRIEPNAQQVEAVRFTFAGNACQFTLRDHRGEHKISVGLGNWIEGRTSMTGNALHHQYQPDMMVVVAGGRWIDPQTFEMTWQFAETAFRDRVICRFDGDRMTLDRSVNVNSADTSLPTLRGRLA